MDPATVEMIAQLKARIDTLEAEIERLREDNAHLRKDNARLVEENARLKVRWVQQAVAGALEHTLEFHRSLLTRRCAGRSTCVNG